MPAYKRSRTSERVERRAMVARTPSVPRSRFSRSVTNRSYKFIRTLQQAIPINQLNGFNSAGVSLVIAPALNACSFWIGAAVVYQPVMPGVAELQSLFDTYKIHKVRYQIYFSNNESGVNAPNTVLPLLHIANDYNDVATIGLTEIQQYPAMRSYQCGTERPIKWSVKPRVRLDANPDPGLANGIAAYNTTGFLDTSAAGVMHLGTKIVFNNLARATNIDIGSIVVMCTYELEFRNVK